MTARPTATPSPSTPAGQSLGAMPCYDSFSPHGIDLFGNPINLQQSALESKFLVSPFTVLSARDGKWQSRKAAWLSMGIASETGRAEGLIGGGNRMGYDMLEKIDGCKRESNGTSVFDPVLGEIAYRWWSGEGMQVVDPFAGGSVRGVVAASMGRKYWGSELRQEQVDANRQQAAKLCPANPPQYVCGDSMETMDHAPDADFIFSCPPYGDLEKYSDSPQDLSSMEWHTFVAAYKLIILRACKRLKQDRFACFVVGDFRCPKGFYRNFVSETINGFESCGVRLYNEAILLTALGNAGMRADRQFSAARKLIKTHQNVLVFCKGNPRKATSSIYLHNSQAQSLPALTDEEH